MSVWDEVKAKLNIEDVLGDYLPVKPNGRNYKAICPFHREKNPSLIISPEKQIWHCFGCGAGGDIFAFVEQYENLSKSQTLKLLAKKAGVQIQSKQYTQTEKLEIQKTLSKLEKGFDLLDWTAEIYHQVLLKILDNPKHPVTSYVASRGLTMKTIQAWKIGYAPTQNFLLKLAQKHGLDQSLLVETSILKERDDVKISDKFVDRLVIPIRDSKARTVGFTARNFPYDKLDRPKYLNTAQTEWFDKSKLWFGWDRHLTHIRAQRRVLIVEGNMDVIACSSYGLEIALASQGTSFTSHQLQQLKRLGAKVLLAFDNDQAGRIASRKFFLEASKIGLEVHKVLIPKEFKDLDEYLQNHQIQNLDQLKIVGFLDWDLDQNLPALNSLESAVQRQAVRDFLGLLSVVDPITKEQYLNRLSKHTEISINTLRGLVQNSVNQNQSSSDQDLPSAPKLNFAKILLVKFQNLLTYPQLTDPDLEQKLTLLWPLVQHFEEDLNSTSDWQSYLSLKQSELELLEPIQDFDWELKTILSLLDTKIQDFLLDPQLQQNYLELRQLLN